VAHRILVTGAAGAIARQVVPHLRHHELTLIDVDPAAGDRVEGPVEIVDLAADDDRLAALMDGQDAVLHLANRAAGGPLAHDQDQDARVQELYEVEQANVDMMQTVYRLALQAGVRRVVTASSNQAAKWYEEPYYQGIRQNVRPDEYPRPVSFYGWAKVAYESLGFLYASGHLGRRLEVVALRIVVPRQVRLADFVGQPTARYFRDIVGYISERDLGQLTERAITVEDVRDGHGVPFLIVYGTSANARRFWDLTTARQALGYEPCDDSEVAFAADIRAVLDDGGSTVTAAMVEAATAARQR
jgi:UDP-glucose 4-epimerase